MSIPKMGQDFIQIRFAKREDVSQIAEILAESFAEYESLYTPEGFDATTPTNEQIMNRFDEGPIWIALHNEKIVGTVSAVSKGNRLYIRSMAVLPKERGKRIGELLLKEIENFATERGYESLVLSTTPFLNRAIRLYENFGFKRKDEAPFDLFQTPLFTMVKKLNHSEG